MMTFIFLDFLLAYKDQLSVDDMELLCLVVWSVWYRQNGLVHNSAIVYVEDVVPWVVSFHEDYKRANSKVVDRSGRLGVEAARWSHPIAGSFKVNTDAAVDSVIGLIGIRVNIGDSES
ncbi:hypothetical protein Ddye_008834 [Dipteronia dyeriana]|uniref:Uncharacterized protein n=1 Tax=Dipteronia dyeriana TaxID=168575 RepID=A0AAE0CLP8_9ROSI|nr:hypothetical protein Ddye_008834 [Dipteronia dyeriana]